MTSCAMLFQGLLACIFPPLCHLCKTGIADNREIHICDACGEALPPVDSPRCTVCGVPFGTLGGNDHRCSACSSLPPPFVAARAALLYEGHARQLIHRFKYEYRVQLARPLGLLTARHLDGFIADMRPELIVPVPLHPKRLRQRCFNQAILLGEVLARKWRLPMERHNLRRIRWTEPQITLTAAERVLNVRGAFDVGKPTGLAGKRLLLVDDVYTTGSTAAECSSVLLAAGADSVLVATVARALAH